MKPDNNIGIVYKVQGDYDSALEYYLKVLTIYEALNVLNKSDYNSKTGLGAAYNNLGLMYYTMGNYSDALQYHLKSLKVKEEINDLSGIAYSYNNIAIVYDAQGNTTMAMENYMQSLNIRIESGDKKGMAASYNNIATMLSDRGEFTRALEYLVKSVKIKEEIGDKSGLAASYSNIGTLYYELGCKQENTDSSAKNFKSALYYFREVLQMDEENNDKHGITSSLINIGLVLARTGMMKEAHENLHKGSLLARETGELELIKLAYQAIAEYFEKAGNFREAYEYHRKYAQVKDSLLNEESNRQISDMAAKYESEKKEKKIILLEKEQEIKVAESYRQRLLLFLVLAIAVSAAVIATVVFRTLRVTRQQKIIIEKQKKMVEEHQQEIIDSITYARGLQDAILPPLSHISNQLPESFVIYKPKDIIAGDFFWFESFDDNNNTKTIFIAVADCTGHGVPGAMVSVVCSNALNRAVKEFGLRETGKILDKVTDLVLETFEKSASEVKDGMDISLLRIARGLTVAEAPVSIQWSGANNPLWYIENDILKEIPADKQPVGKFDLRKPFATHELIWLPGATYYLFSDGMPDQFGGPKGKKFMYKRFEETLLSASTLPVKNQKEKIENAFTQWKGAFEQIDDVTVIGLKA